MSVPSHHGPCQGLKVLLGQRKKQAKVQLAQKGTLLCTFSSNNKHRSTFEAPETSPSTNFRHTYQIAQPASAHTRARSMTRQPTPSDTASSTYQKGQGVQAPLPMLLASISQVWEQSNGPRQRLLLDNTPTEWPGITWPANDKQTFAEVFELHTADNNNNKQFSP